MVWVPPAPLVVVWASVQLLPSFEVWILNAVAYALSQVSTTRLMLAEVPRSIRSHCGSLNELDHRVPVRSPSKAAAAL